jgi:hypothetical protein
MVRVEDDLSRREKVLSTCDKGRDLSRFMAFLAKRSRTAVPKRRREALIASDGRGVHGIKAIRSLHELMRQQQAPLPFMSIQLLYNTTCGSRNNFD